MISDITLEIILNLWKKDKITLDEARKLLNLEQGITWRQPNDLTPPLKDTIFTPTIFTPWHSPDPQWENPYTISCTEGDSLTIDYKTREVIK